MCRFIGVDLFRPLCQGGLECIPAKAGCPWHTCPLKLTHSHPRTKSTLENVTTSSPPLDLSRNSKIYMHRTNPTSSSRFSAFRKPHEILSAVSPTNPFSHSRARNRSSGGSSVGSQQGQPSLLVEDSMDDDDRIVSRTASRTASRTSKSRSRSVSPSWGGLSTHSIPLLPMHEGSSGSGAGRSLLSRTPSPYPRKSDDLGDDPTGLRTGARGSNPGSETGLASWGRNGKLGWWLRDTQRGWMVYIGLLVVFYSGASFGLSVVNSFTLSSKSESWHTARNVIFKNRY